MAFMDNQLAFSSTWSTPQAISATADSARVVDITGAGSGNAPAMINGFPATNTAIGEDYGAGDGVAIPYLYLTTTATGTGTGTITISINAAPDNGSYSPGTYTQLYSTAAIVGNTLPSGSTLLVPLPPTLFNFPSEALPRFYKLIYTVSGTAGTSVLAGLMLNPPSTLLLGKYNNNFTVV